jgi:glycosyltransferase involved in cell wall biosynthesis
MKILIDARLYGLEHAGLGRYTMNLIRELSFLDKENQYVILLRKKYFNKLKLPKNWEKVKADFRHYSLIEQIKLPAILAREKPDVVHFPHFNVPLAFKSKFVVTIHDIIMHKFKGRQTTTRSPLLYFIKRIFYKLIFNKAVKDSKRILVPTKFTKKELIDDYQLKEKKLTVTYEGLDNKFICRSAKKKILKKYNLDSDYFIYFGNAYPHKNLERLVEAMVLLNTLYKDKIYLAMASSRSVFTKRLEEYIKKNRADKYVKLLGFVPDQELACLLKHSLAFVYPSLYEGFGLQGLEAMASETLVLASDIPVFREVYKNNVLYFNPYDFSSIEKAMKEVIEMSSKERERLIKKAKKFIKRYSWTKMAKQTLEVYHKVVK